MFEDKDEKGPFDAAKPRVIRGGSFSHLPSNLRCAYRNWEVPRERYTYGIRPARTVR